MNPPHANKMLMQDSPKSQAAIEKHGQPEGKPNKCIKPQREGNDQGRDQPQQRSKLERFRRWLKRWKILLQLLVPSIFSIAILLVVVWQAIIYKRQWEVMQKQLAQAKAIQESSDRAWIVVKGAALKKPIKVGERAAAKVLFTNTGKTPAQETVTLTWIVISKPTPKEKLERTDISERSSGTHAPGVEYEADIETQDALTREEVDALISDSYRLYVYGTISYDDVFGHHWTDDFCLFNRPAETTYLVTCSELSKSH
jgi:hypothetical protein